MRAEDLWRYYPKLYHIAWGGSWPSIQEHGLLSTKALLRAYGKGGREIAALTQERRGHWVEIECPGRPRAVVRDQKPLSDKGLGKALPPSVKPSEWYDLINSMVFFWPTKAKLETMITARAYRRVSHDVLVLDTERLVRLEEPDIRLSPINSGSTIWKPQPRDLGLFKRIEDYQFPAKPTPSKVAKAVAEVCVVDRVERIVDAVLDVRKGTAGAVMMALAED